MRYRAEAGLGDLAQNVITYLQGWVKAKVFHSPEIQFN